MSAVRSANCVGRRARASPRRRARAAASRPVPRVDMHSKDARALDETEQRLDLLDAWEEAPFYSERERAALALTEAVTRITEGHVADAVFERARAHFNEQELTALVFTMTTINAWNRLAVTMRTEVGKYQPKARPVSQTA